MTFSAAGFFWPWSMLNDNNFLKKIKMNHQLAGETLTFEIEVVGISDTPTQALSGCGCGCDCSPDSC